MSSLNQKFINFMRGRYGSDTLNRTIFWTYVVLIAVNIFIRSPYVYIAAFLLAAVYIFRSLSRNTVKRSAENRKFKEAVNTVKNFFFGIFGKKADREHVFRKCPHCKAKLRLPRKRGNHIVRCPKCGNTFDVRIIF